MLNYRFVGVCLVLVVSTTTSSAWWVKGHAMLAEAAAGQLPDDMPPFFRSAATSLGHLSGDPDRWKNRDTACLRTVSEVDHYIDLENLQGKPLPKDRFQAIALIAQLGETPRGTGLLPYALMENYERLCMAFCDHRQDPANDAIRMKCIVYAGVLSHFSGDASMPLHTTRDYDGRVAKQNAQRGIHSRIDAFPEKQGLTWEEIGRGHEAREVDDVWKHIVAFIVESHRHVDRCYELDATGSFDKPTGESRAFILERCQAGTQFTADLWYTAWKRSAKLHDPY